MNTTNLFKITIFIKLFNKLEKNLFYLKVFLKKLIFIYKIDINLKIKAIKQRKTNNYFKKFLKNKNFKNIL
jgi:hypothetical protein